MISFPLSSCFLYFSLIFSNFLSNESLHIFFFKFDSELKSGGIIRVSVSIIYATACRLRKGTIYSFPFIHFQLENGWNRLMSENKPQKILSIFQNSQRIQPKDSLIENWKKFRFIEENKRQVTIALNNEHTFAFTFQWMCALIGGKIGVGDAV